MSLGGAPKGPIPYTKQFILKKAKVTLYPKRDHLVRQASRLGIRVTQLKNTELINLYYEVYNPDIELLRERKQETSANIT